MHPYIIPLVKTLQAHADPVKAAPMKKYMKDRYEYLGISQPQRTALQREHYKTHGLPAVADLPVIVKELWTLDEREYQYAALDLLEKMVKKLDDSFLPLFEYMVVTKSWWDTVDYIAIRLAGEVLYKYREQWRPVAEQWYYSNNMWLQRTTIIFQLKYSKETDTDLLFELIDQSAGSKEFFIRKAIGWALREHSKTDEATVRAFVDVCPLSNFSKNEALKWLNKRK
jgi:3-methyladenine DNA glycosylase AlkD